MVCSDRGDQWLSNYPDQWSNISNHLVKIAQWSGKGKIASFNIGRLDRGDRWLSDYPDQWSDFSDHPVHIVQWLGKGKIASFNIGGYDRGDHWLSDYLDLLSDIGDHLVHRVQWSGRGYLLVTLLVGMIKVRTEQMIKFQQSPSKNCPVIGQGENCQFQYW